MWATPSATCRLRTPREWWRWLPITATCGRTRIPGPGAAMRIWSRPSICWAGSMPAGAYERRGHLRRAAGRDRTRRARHAAVALAPGTGVGHRDRAVAGAAQERGGARRGARTGLDA